MTAHDCLVSLGSNLGARHPLLAAAAAQLAGSGVVTGPLRTSRLYQTPPIGGPGGQEPFLNAVARFRTTASASEVLARLQTIERDLGRTREHRWAARTVDLDVVLHGQLAGRRSPADRRGLIGGGTSLVVPHPRYTARRFILQPARDVASDLHDPRFGWSIADLATHLDAAVPSMVLVGGQAETRRRLADRLTGRCVIAMPDQPPPTRPWVGIDWSIDQLGGRRAPDFPVPRLVGRIDGVAAADRWPATHQLWPTGARWPEYRLEAGDVEWATGEILSALDSMACPVTPVSDDGGWW